MLEGELDQAQSILRPMLSQERYWYIFANYGRILEAMHTLSRALEQYELAMVELELIGPQKNKTAASVQIRVARCYNALKRPGDARRALLIALDYDPDNLTAQLELDKGIY